MNTMKAVAIGLAVALAVLVGYVIYLYQGPIQRIGEENQNLLAQIEQMKTASTDLIAAHQSERDTSNIREKELEDKIKSLRETVARVTKDRESVESELENLIVHFRKDKESIEAGLQAKVDRLENQLAQKQRELQASRDEARQLKASHEKIKADHDIQLTEKISLVEALQRKSSELGEVILRTREETRTIEADLRETIESLETQLIQRELELQASRSEAIELKTASAETGATYKAELADKIRIVEDLQVKSSGLEQALDRIKSETESLESDLQSAILGLENQLAQWDRERQTSRKEAQKLHLTIANLQNRNSNLRQGLKELHQRLENSREEIEIISAENAAQRDRLAEVEATRRELERRVKTQEKEKAELQRLKDALKNQLGMMQRQIEALSMDADAKENQLVTKDQQLKSMDQAYQELSRQLEQQIKKKDIQISTLEDKMKIRLLDKTLFASGSADVTAAGYRVLNSLASALKKMDGFEIAVAGHSDNMPLGSKIKSVYHDNLGLSVARAAAVSRALKNMGVSPDNLSAIGYSEYRPIADNDTKEGRQQNRRVEIMLEPLR